MSFIIVVLVIVYLLSNENPKTPKRLKLMANIDDCYTPARGYTATFDNFAIFDAISQLPDPCPWKESVFTKSYRNSLLCKNIY